jgi:hypothetical protein
MNFFCKKEYLIEWRTGKLTVQRKFTGLTWLKLLQWQREFLDKDAHSFFHK